MRTYLQSNGFDVVEADDGDSARRALAAGGLDLVILDLGLPDQNGLEVLRDLRSTSGVAVIVVTARGEEADRVAGLELGADDYVVKPVSLRELTARIGAVLRRGAYEEAAARLRFGRLAIDTTAREVTVDGRPVELTRLEYDLLTYLAAAPRRTFTYEQLLVAVWGSSTDWQARSTVSEHIYRLRRKLGGAAPIATMRGVGYRFDP